MPAAGGWTLVAAFFATQPYLDYRSPAVDLGLGQTFVLSLLHWYLWAALTPAIFRLSRRYPLHPRPQGGRLLLHVLASAAFAVLHWISLVLAVWAVPLVTIRMLSMKLHGDLLTYFTLVGIAHGIDIYRQARQRELRTSQLQAQLAQAQLAGLKMQLQPHFLFNTLHSIAELMHEDLEAADKMIVRLSDLLRLSLENIETQEVPLHQELEFARRYLEIEETRFGDRLLICQNLGPDVHNAQVPYLLLQPLLENAIRHGISRRAGPGTLSLSVRRVAQRLEIRVEDDGPGLEPEESTLGGIGLSNTRARLEQLYGDAQHLAIEQRPAGGLAVVVLIPFTVKDRGSDEGASPTDSSPHRR